MAELLKAKNANDLWINAKSLLEIKGSRNSATKEVLHVLLELKNPIEKWIYKRNPPISIGFALAELMWITNGSNDSKIINFWNPLLKYFAEDKGKDIYHGAYG